MFNMFVLMVALVPSSNIAKKFYLLTQNGDDYMAAKLPCKQIAKIGRGHN